jgi:chloramphenicol 3-O phosphotransferase
MKGRAIIINGGSSTGKTSLGKALQHELTQPYLLMGIDLFWFTMPEKQIDLDTVDPEFYTWTQETKDNVPYFRIIPGPILDSMMIARYKAIATYLEDGLNVIADDVIWKRLWLEECLKSLSPYEVYFVGLFCDERILAQREIQRGDRRRGWARGSQIYTHMDTSYDLRIDNSDLTPQQEAKLLAEKLTNGLKPQAFAEMRDRLLTTR